MHSERDLQLRQQQQRQAGVAAALEQQALAARAWQQALSGGSSALTARLQQSGYSAKSSLAPI